MFFWLCFECYNFLVVICFLSLNTPFKLLCFFVLWLGDFVCVQIVNLLSQKCQEQEILLEEIAVREANLEEQVDNKQAFQSDIAISKKHNAYERVKLKVMALSHWNVWASECFSHDTFYFLSRIIRGKERCGFMWMLFIYI